MNRLRLIVLLGLSLAFSGSSFAKDHRDKDRDRDDVRHHDRDRHRDHDRDRDGDRDRDHDRDHRIRHNDHDRDDRRIAWRHHRSTPPGADHGKKVGWGNCNMPPGQAKKSGCNTVHHRRRHRHVGVRRDEDHDGDRQ